MKVIKEGCEYELQNLEGVAGVIPQTVSFTQKKPNKEDPTKLDTIKNGTTNEEVLEMMINRLQFLIKLLPDPHTREALRCMNAALDHLNERTKQRKARGVEGTHKA